MGESTRFLGGSWRTKIYKRKVYLLTSLELWITVHSILIKCKSEAHRASLTGFGCHWVRTSVFTYVISGWQILIFTAGVSFLSVQQQVVDHLLLVLPAERVRGDVETGDKKKRRQTVQISFMLTGLENTESLSQNLLLQLVLSLTFTRVKGHPSIQKLDCQ